MLDANFPTLWEGVPLHSRRLLMHCAGAKLNDHGERWRSRHGTLNHRPPSTTTIRRALERRHLLGIGELRVTDLGHSLARWAEDTGRWPRLVGAEAESA